MGINSLDSQFRGFRGVNVPIVPTTTLEELAVEGYPLNDSEYFLEVEGITGVHHDILEEIKYKYGFDREQVVKILLQPKYKGVTTQQLQEEYITNPTPITAEQLTQGLNNYFGYSASSGQNTPKTLSKAEDTKDNTLLYVGIGAGVLALCGGAYWYFSK